MKITELEKPLFEVYDDPAGYGFYAISDGNPSFCIHAPSLAGLGTRVAAVLAFHAKRSVDNTKHS